jgi:hypothetical protein
MHEEINRLRREVRALRWCTIGGVGLLGLLFVTGFQPAVERARFSEIDVERINVVEKDGRQRMVIANRERTPGPIHHGTPFAYGPGRRAGMIFYNDEGTESGGLVFTGKEDGGGNYSSTGSLTFDQFNQDQVVALQHIDNNGRRRQGLQILDRPAVPVWEMIDRIEAIRDMPAGAARDEATKEFQEYTGGIGGGVTRLYVGRTPEKASVVDLHDPAGKSRLRLAVDSLGNARIEFLDEGGRADL